MPMNLNSKRDIFDEAELYIKSENFNVVDFINHIRPMSNNDLCIYLCQFVESIHPTDIITDMAIFQTTLKSGQRPKDVVQQRSHLVGEFCEALKLDGDTRVMEYSIQSMMPIRYYFQEIADISSYWNTEIVDKIDDLDEMQKKRMKFMLL